MCLASVSVSAILGFTSRVVDDERLVFWSNRRLQSWFNPEAGNKLKSWNLNVTHDCFVRYKVYYTNKKQEYYSFYLGKFKDMDYLGTSSNGILRLFTTGDDIIVQTYHDSHGDVDSMATHLDLPLHDVSAEQLDSMRNTLLLLRESR